MSARITDLGIAAIRVMDEPNLTNLAEYGDLIRAEYDAELTALRQQVAALRALVESIVTETDAYDDHDGQLGHIAYATIVDAQRYLAATQPQEVQP